MSLILHGTQCPPDLKGSFDALAGRVPDDNKVDVGEILQAGLAAGLPWSKLLSWLASNLDTILEMLKNGISVASIVKMIKELLDIIAGAPPVTG